MRMSVNQPNNEPIEEWLLSLMGISIFEIQIQHHVQSHARAYLLSVVHIQQEAFAKFFIKYFLGLIRTVEWARIEGALAEQLLL